MKKFIYLAYIRMRCLREEHGQDLIEYALVASLIALAATVGMGTVANAINSAFSSVGNKLNTYTS